MRKIIITLSLLLASNALATEGVEINIFAKTVRLVGNCKFWPSISITPSFVCLNDGKTYTVTFPVLTGKESVESQLLIDPETAKKWHYRILSENSETINGLVYVRSSGVTEDGAIYSSQYIICNESNCIAITAEKLATYRDVINQLSTKIIKVKENESDL